MSYNIYSIPPFDKQLKRLSKKYPSLKSDFAEFLNNLENNPIQGNALIKNCYKVRMPIKSKGKGKSGGSRIITHIQFKNNNVILLAIYDKSEQTDISNRELNYLLSFIE